MRLRPGLEVGRVADLARAIDEVDVLLVRTHEDVRLGSALRWVLQALAEADAAHIGEPAAVGALLDSTTGWGLAVANAIASALAYRTPQQRRTAMALAAEESAMRLIMSVEPARVEATLALARSGNDEEAHRLRRAVIDLGTRVDVADRMLHARIMTAAVR
jgi:hypothetical protein